jgi:hypothetical protein
MRKLLLLLFGIAMLSSELLAQTRTITGKITDPSGLPLPLASITIKGETSGTSTDKDGVFVIQVPSSAKVLIVSAIGFAAQEIAIDQKSQITVQLSTQNKDLDEVVVVAYGSVKKE